MHINQNHLQNNKSYSKKIINEKLIRQKNTSLVTLKRGKERDKWVEREKGEKKKKFRKEKWGRRRLGRLKTDDYLRRKMSSQIVIAKN